MKKPFLLKLFAAVMLICVALATLVACEDENVTVRVRFMVDGEEYAVVEVNDRNQVEMPSDPPSDDKVFDGWY